MKIKYGTNRVVFLVGRWAVKVPSCVEWRLFLVGLLANMQEAKFSRAGFPEVCPVVFYFPGGFLNVMRRAEPLTMSDFENLDYAEWIKGGVTLPRGEWIIPVENKLDSFGKLEGKVVAVDYGS